jgi:tRNA threonylcarbamoyladenosine biosynthesis protein TsaB
MMILAVDTSTSSCSVALFNDQRLLAEETYTAGKTHSRHLLSIIHRILEACRCDPSAIEGIAVTRGPGTFTGLRIGISTVKGLAVATRARVVGVSSLAALAFPLSLVNRPVVAMIDARRGEVYHARYQWGADGVLEATTPPSVDAPETVAASLPEAAILVGSGAVLYREVFVAVRPDMCFGDPTQHVIRAAAVGRLAWDRFRHADVDAVEALIPEYIRKSDAQIHMSSSC